MIGIGINTTLRGINGTTVSLPVAIEATGIGETSFTANWNPYPGAIYYLLDVSTSSSFSTFVYQDQYTTSTSYVVIGLSANTTYYYRVRANTEYDVDAQAFFNRVTTAGGTLTTTEMNAVNTLVGQMKSYGVWTAMKAVYPMVGASAAACAQNLKSASFTGTFTSGWTFASTGATPNGTSAYMDTQFVESTNLSSTSKHLSFYSRTQNSSTPSHDLGAEIFVSGSYISFDLYLYYSDVSFKGFLDGVYPTNAAQITNTNTLGFQIGSRTSSTSQKLYFNNALLATNTTLNTYGQVTNSVYLSATNRGSAVAYSNRQCAFASIGDGLTDTQASNLYTAVQTFNQTLNRQVGAQIVSDADAQAFVNRVYTAGGSLTNTEANAVNQLVIDMKAAGIWTSMKAVYPMVGSSAAACAQNLKSSSFTGTFTSGWTFSSTGATGNGTSAYMNTGFVPNGNLTQGSAGLSVYRRTANVQNGQSKIDLGCCSFGSPFLPLIYFKGRSGAGLFEAGAYSYNVSDGGLSTSNSQTIGFYQVHRTSTTLIKGYNAGTSFVSSTNSNTAYSVTGVTANMFLGAMNLNGTTTEFNDTQYAFASIGDGLNDTQAASLYSCVNTFQVSLSRNI